MERNHDRPARLTVSQAAEALDVSIATIRRWCAEGLLHAEKHGRAWVILDVPRTCPTCGGTGIVSGEVAP